MTTHHPYTPDPEQDFAFVSRDVPELFQRGVIERSRDSDDGVPEADRRLFENLYDESIRHVDRRVGALLEEINLDDTVVIMTGDHGEGFWEHGYPEHPPELHQELLHVPLVIRHPEGDPDTIEQPVGLSVIPETLERLATEGTISSDTFAIGEPIHAGVTHESVDTPESSSLEHLRIAVRDGAWKYIRVDAHDPEGTGELYNLESDPGETVNLATDNSSIVEDMESQVRDFRDDLTFSGFSEAPEKIRDQLEDLGYL